MMALNRELERREQLLRELVVHIGGTLARCRTCGESIFFVAHEKKRPDGSRIYAPYDFTGQNHWATCKNPPRRKENVHAAAATADIHDHHA
jgi:hypothetical protein